MESTEIQAVEMTRRIRAGHAKILRDATPEERISFYRQKASRLNDEVEAAGKPPVSPIPQS